MSLAREVNEFYQKMEETHTNFTQTLLRKHPSLFKSEIRLAILLRLEIPLKEVASLMNISPQNMQNLLYGLKEKLQLPDKKNLEKYLQNIKN